MRLLTTLLVLLGFISCNQNENISGVYIANNKLGADTLIILKSGTFQQHFINAKGLSYYNTGTWELSEGKLGLEDFIWYMPGMGPIDKHKVFWAATYNISLIGQTNIVINNDLDLFYKKK